ncbi:MAG: endonuclease domain-containing protein [Candidatus Riflebacteria bacterium]|nr:endonuclease domain-containing protein [Candidatus Riflebacteria bacterium]
MNYKRNHKFPQKSYFWEAVNGFGEDMVYKRNEPPIKPEYQIFFETETHYMICDLRLRDKYVDQEHLMKLDEEMFKLTEHRINAVRRINPDGRAEYLYRRTNGIVLTPDFHFDTYVKFFFNFRDYVKLVYRSDKHETGAEFDRNFQTFFCRWFTDSRGKEIQAVNSEKQWFADVKKWLLKKKQNPAYSVPHSEFKDTPIEVKIEGILVKNKIAYTKQAEFFEHEMKFTVPDFLIEDKKIAIYCDGTEFHKDTQAIIRDKVQDRKLQIKGYMVLRFSGSEILGNQALCEEDILQAIKARSKNQP